MLWWCISAHETVHLHNWKDPISVKRNIQVLEHHMFSSRWHSGKAFIFQDVKLQSSAITTAQLIYCRKVQLTDCLLSRPFTDWKHLSHRDRTGNKNGATEVQQPLSSVPRSLQTVAESRRDAPQWETWSQRHVVSTKFKISSYFSLNCTFVQFKHWRVLSVLLHMKHEFVSL